MRARFWSNVGAIAYKETSIMRHDRAFLSMVLAQPIIMMILFGWVLSNQPANVPWAVLDRDGTAASRTFVRDLFATGYFLEPWQVSGYEEGMTLLQSGDALAFVVVPKSFRRDLERGRPRVQILLDGSDPLAAARIGAYVSQIGIGFEPDVRASPAHDPDARIRSRDAVDLRQQFWFNPTLRDREFFLAGFVGALLTNLCLSVMSLGIVSERENGTYEQVLAQPTSALEIVLGKVAPYVAICYAVAFFTTIAVGLIFGIWPRGSWLALGLVTLPFVLASLAIGVFVSTLAHTSAQAVFITVFFILPSFVLSGIMLPYQFMPHGVREIGGLFPLRWYQIALRRIIERGTGLPEVAVPCLMMVGLFGVLLAAIRWRMKPRLG